LNDWNVMPEHSVHVYQELKKQGVPVQLYLHQGGHGGEPPLPQMNRWFTRYLYEVENGVEDDPLCRIVREGASPSEPTPYPDFPNPAAKFVTLLPGAGGGAIGTLVAGATGAAASSAHEKLTDDASIAGAELAKAAQSPHRLLYATPPLTEGVHISGTPRVKIRMTCSKPATNLSVWLVSLPWTGGRDMNADLINRGWVDPQNHASLTKGEPLAPGKFYDVAFDLQPDDQVIPAGEQIGFMIFASDREFTLWPEPGTELTVDLAATSLELPIVGGADALKKASAKAAR
jgi:X-Pro dipeptidyl-peptidase